MPVVLNPVVRHLTVAQALYVGGSTVDLTVTGIVGSRLAPVAALATLPFSLIFVAAGLSTVLVSRSIGRFGYRSTFVSANLVAAAGGCVSAVAVQLSLFPLFCVGVALTGAANASAGYYRYLAADTNPRARSQAISRVLAGGLLAALVGPFAATAVRDVTSAPFAASYLLVAAIGLAAAAWNSRLEVAARSVGEDPGPAEGRPGRELWRQRSLLIGVSAAVLAAVTMLAIMTAGPILGLATGRSTGEAALAVQLHLIGMYAPGFLVPRWIGRFGERLVAATGSALIVVAGLAAATSVALPAYLLAMLAVGVGWNLAYSGGSALIAASYTPAERGRVQPVAEVLVIAAQVGGSFAAAGFTMEAGWHALGLASAAAALAVGGLLLLDDRRAVTRAA